MSSKRVRFVTFTGVVFALLIIGVSLLLTKLRVETRPFDLPEPQAGASDGGGQGGTDEHDTGLTLVEVTTATVQDVIASLKRPVSYSRQISAVNYYADGSAQYTIDVYVLENAKALKITGAGLTKHAVITDGVLYVWEDGDKDVYKTALDASEDETKLSDMFQMVLTYEDIPAVDPASITYADYGEYGGEMCIIVRYATERLHYLTTCYISSKNGLLVGVEQYDGDKLVYTMTASDVNTDFYDTAPFDLPDGTNVLGGL